jgi:tetratricopeptide (TPR) repeat protein
MFEKRSAKIAILLGIWLYAGGSADPVAAQEKYKTFVLASPEIVLEGVRKIAIQEFEGEDGLGKKLADRLSGQLIRGNRGIKAVAKGGLGGLFGKEKFDTHIVGGRTDLYEIIARAELSDLLDEIELSNTGITEDIIEFGRIKGIDAYVTGAVSYAHSDEQSTSTYGVGPDYKIERTVSLQGMVKVISVSSGQVIGQKAFREESKDSQTSSKGFRHIESKAPEIMVEALVTQMAEDMAGYFSPYYKLREYEFESVKASKYAKLAAKAEKQIKNRDINRAYNIYLHIHEQDLYNPKGAYNLGMLNEMVGNYEVALEFYQRAYGLKQRKNYKSALDRAERNILLRDMLAESGVEIEPYEFELEDGVADMAAKVRLKGRDSDRVKIRAQPKKSAEIIAEVPGGMELVLLEKAKKWYLVELIDGKSGYIRATAVVKDKAR